MSILSFSAEADAWFRAWKQGDLLMNVKDALEWEESILNGQYDLLRESAPDLVVYDSREADKSVLFERAFSILNKEEIDIRYFGLRGKTLKQVLDDALRLGHLAGCGKSSMSFLFERESRLQALMESQSAKTPKKAGLIVSLEPAMLGGWWIPDLLDRAGFDPVGPSPGEDHYKLGANELERLGLQVLFIAENSTREKGNAETSSMLKDLISNLDVKDGEVIYIDCSMVLEPGPGLYRGITELAKHR